MTYLPKTGTIFWGPSRCNTWCMLWGQVTITITQT